MKFTFIFCSPRFVMWILVLFMTDLVFEGDTGKDAEGIHRLYLLPPEMWALSIQDVGGALNISVFSVGRRTDIGSLCLKGPSFVPPNENKPNQQQCVRTATKQSCPFDPLPSEHRQQSTWLLWAHVGFCMCSSSARGHCTKVPMSLSVAAGPLLRCVPLVSPLLCWTSICRMKGTVILCITLRARPCYQARPGMGSVNLATLDTESGGSQVQATRPAWAAEQVWGQPVQLSETLTKK